MPYFSTYFSKDMLSVSVFREVKYQQKWVLSHFLGNLNITWYKQELSTKRPMKFSSSSWTRIRKGKRRRCLRRANHSSQSQRQTILSLNSAKTNSKSASSFQCSRWWQMEDFKIRSGGRIPSSSSSTRAIIRMNKVQDIEGMEVCSAPTRMLTKGSSTYHKT